MKDLKVLIVDLNNWTGIARLPRVLSQSGFRVATLSFSKAFVSLSQYVDFRYTWDFEGIQSPDLPTEQFAAILSEKVKRWNPQWLIPADDLVVNKVLQMLHMPDKDKKGISSSLSKLLRDSFSLNEHYTWLYNKEKALHLARVCGINTPQEKQARRPLDVYDFIEEHGLPVVLKLKTGSAGRGVIIVHELGQVPQFFKLHQNAPTIVQQYIHGKPVLRTSVAWQGEDLESVCFIKKECFPGEQGPGSVVEWLQNDDIELSAKTLAGKSDATGFLSFGFMLEESTGRACLIECNLRPTPVTHLGRLYGRNLCKAMYCRLAGETYTTEAKSGPQEIALFPQEWQRNPGSFYIKNCLHDVPWDEPELLQRLVQSAATL